MQPNEFRGTFTFIVEASSQESAEDLAEAQLSQVLLHWRVEDVTSD